MKKINFESKYLSKKLKILNIKKKDYYETITVNQLKLSKYFEKKNIKEIDLLKIDTEGSEFEVLKGLEENIKNINYIFFEHHYDDMIKKDYKFGDISRLLKEKKFRLIFKSKMPFRRTFEYIYQNLRIN